MFNWIISLWLNCMTRLYSAKALFGFWPLKTSKVESKCYLFFVNSCSAKSYRIRGIFPFSAIFVSSKSTLVCAFISEDSVLYYSRCNFVKPQTWKYKSIFISNENIQHFQRLNEISRYLIKRIVRFFSYTKTNKV